jgi:hypothetical protein
LEEEFGGGRMRLMEEDIRVLSSLHDRKFANVMDSAPYHKGRNPSYCAESTLLRVGPEAVRG